MSVTVAVTVWFVPTGFVAVAGLSVSDVGAPVGSSFVTKASPPMSRDVSNAPVVVGKLLDSVRPVTYAWFVPSTVMPKPRSALVPPRNVP